MFRKLPVFVLVLVLLIGFIVRIRLIDAPLERDEGEHAYIAQTMLAGNPPWKLAYNMKLPGSDAVYALAMIAFGETVPAIRIALLLVNTATILLVVLLGKRLAGTDAGLISGAAYGVLTLSQNVVGTTFHSTHLVALFTVIAALLLLRARLSPSILFGAGLACSAAFLMKQPGIAFAGFGTIFLLWRLREMRSRLGESAMAVAMFSAGLVLPCILMGLALWKAGFFDRFWFWTVTLAAEFATQRPLDIQYIFLKNSLPLILSPNLPLWILTGAGLTLALAHRPLRRAALFISALLFFSGLAVSAGGVFSTNYYIMMFPAVSLAAGTGISAAKRLCERSPAPHAPIVCFALVCLFSIAVQRHYLFAMQPFEFSRSSYGLNPFPEAREVGRYIASNSSPEAKIAVLGSEAEIYFYARRRSATGMIFMYGLMEPSPYDQYLQRQMISEIEGGRPEYVVYVRTPASWLERPGSSLAIFEWADQYLRDNFELVGVAEVRKDRAEYLWGAAAKRFLPMDPNFIQVFRRKGQL